VDLTNAVPIGNRIVFRVAHVPVVLTKSLLPKSGKVKRAAHVPVVLTTGPDARLGNIGAQRAELALRLEPIWKAKAAAAQQKHGGTAPGKKSLLLKSGKQTPIHVDKELAKIAGVSEDTIAKASKIRAKAPEEVKQQHSARGGSWQGATGCQ